jgi:hypothetical protein
MREMKTKVTPNRLYLSAGVVSSKFLLVCISIVGLSSNALAEPKFNAPRVYEEPRWNSQIIMRGADKAENDAVPILERDYRPLHVYGNMQRRHHYRGTVIPSHRDRTDMRDAFRGNPVERYR